MLSRITRFASIASALVALAGAAGTAHAVNMVVNGSFEQPTVGAVSQFTTIPGWTRTCGTTIEIQGAGTGLLANDGVQWWEADGVNNTCINQSFTTLPNGQYQLLMAFSPRPGVADNRVGIYWDGNLVATLNASGVGNSTNQWTTVGYTLTATSGTATLELRGAGVNDALGGFIDNVRLEFVGCKPHCPGDANDDGVVNFADITSVLANFGLPCGGIPNP